ncbi:MAG: type II toxin-antitoxin system PemK/MazF family toxin [Candidatus Limnocylindria bacterium]
MPPSTRGDIVLVPFPYSDLRGMKRRLACVVSADAYQRGLDVIVAMITSQAGRRQTPGLGDVAVADWRAAGLRAPSTLRAGRLLVLEQRLLGATLGQLSASTIVELDDALRAVFGLR